MRRLALVTLTILFVAGPLRADVPKGEVEKNDIDKIQGKWTVASIEENGKAEPADELAKYEVTIKGDQFIIKSKDEDHEMSIKLDATPKPPTIDLKPKESGRNPVLGIYKIEGETVTICGTDEKDQPRPKEFSAAKGVTIVVLKRAK